MQGEYWMAYRSFYLAFPASLLDTQKAAATSLPMQILLHGTQCPPFLANSCLYFQDTARILPPLRSIFPSPSGGFMFLLWVPWRLCILLSQPIVLKLFIYMSVCPTRLRASWTMGLRRSVFEMVVRAKVRAQRGPRQWSYVPVRSRNGLGFLLLKMPAFSLADIFVKSCPCN